MVEEARMPGRITKHTVIKYLMNQKIKVEYTPS
jgi:hypothetical protein